MPQACLDIPVSMTSGLHPSCVQGALNHPEWIFYSLEPFNGSPGTLSVCLIDILLLTLRLLLEKPRTPHPNYLGFDTLFV